ncbi:putative cholinesterase protein [Rutstroemia sp. NJR-2017a WRK4]|nr:putative cholinesterase protein [Rutstroemia sp. NJR-2017a WRK4]
MVSALSVPLAKLAFVGGALISSVTALPAQTLPTVDLGYAIHRPTLNSSSQYPYLNFSNIRFGQAPVGDLRFSAPLPPKGRNRTVNDGQHGAICPQAGPAWFATATPFLGLYLTGGNISNYTHPTHATTTSTSSSSLSIDPRTSEDCLFLDVIVPQKIFNSTLNLKKGKKQGAPVLVWIYGGGYVGGYKTSSGSPASLIARSQENGKEGVVYVAMNYRLGAFGWLAGNSNITANVGLLDQRLALEWVQKNIHKFGGDPKRVTVMGESAGAGSIFHQITAYGGKKGPAPFQRAIPQSPAFMPVVPSQAKTTYEALLGNVSLLTNTSVTTAKELRSVPFEALYAANAIVVAGSGYGQFTFGPVVDPGNHSFVPDFPFKLLSQGKFDHNVSVLVGHNSNEGLLFTNPAVQTEPQFLNLLEGALPTANASTASYISEVLYPPVYNGSYGYTSAIQRTSLAIAQLVVDCNAYSIASTFTNKGSGSSFAYVFTVPPGLHGEDVSYTFLNGDTSTADEGLPVSSNIAIGFQEYLTNFAMSGIPSAGTLLPPFVPYGNNQTVTNIASAILQFGSHLKDPGYDQRCNFWLEAPYYKEP